MEQILVGRDESFDEPDIYSICLCCKKFVYKENPANVVQIVRNEILADAAEDQYYWRCVNVALEVISTSIGRAVYFCRKHSVSDKNSVAMKIRLIEGPGYNFREVRVDLTYD